MDQYIVEFKSNFLFWDLVELYDLIKESDNKRLQDYLPEIKHAINTELPNTIE